MNYAEIPAWAADGLATATRHAQTGLKHQASTITRWTDEHASWELRATQEWVDVPSALDPPHLRRRIPGMFSATAEASHTDGVFTFVTTGDVSTDNWVLVQWGAQA